jgi:hypothetical protein
VSGAEAAKEARFGHDWSSTRRLIGGGIGKSRIARTVAEPTDAGPPLFLLATPPVAPGTQGRRNSVRRPEQQAPSETDMATATTSPQAHRPHRGTRFALSRLVSQEDL